MTEGGMYNLLPKILKHLDNAHKEKFTAQELADLSDFSKQSIINNLSKLVASGYLVKHEYRLPNKAGIIIEYSISPYVTELIKEVLY